jgi:hypothetical protein
VTGSRKSLGLLVGLPLGKQGEKRVLGGNLQERDGVQTQIMSEAKIMIEWNERINNNNVEYCKY